MHGRLFNIIYTTSKSPPPRYVCYLAIATVYMGGAAGGCLGLLFFFIGGFRQKYFLTSRRLKRATICLHTWLERQTMPGFV